MLTTEVLRDDVALFTTILDLLKNEVGSQAPEFQGEAWVKVCEARDQLNHKTPPTSLREFCLPHIKEAVREVWYERQIAGSKSGVFGTHLNPQLKPIPSTHTNRPEGFDQTRLFDQAYEKASETMKRNLEWWKLRRFKNQSFETIANEYELRVAQSTVRGGIARAEKYLRKTQDSLTKESTNSQCTSGVVVFDDVHAAYLSGDKDKLRSALASHRPFNMQPVLLNYDGVLALWEKRQDDADALFKEALVYADKHTLRCIIANNMGLLFEEKNKLEDARAWYDRAKTLNPKAPTPLLNLLGITCMKADPDFSLHEQAKLLHYIDCITLMLSSKSTSENDKRHLLEQLANNSDFAPARRTSAWKRIRLWLNRRDTSKRISNTTEVNS